MLLTSDRLEVAFGDRVRGVLNAALLVSNEEIQETLQDIGFRHVAIFAEDPGWPSHGKVTDNLRDLSRAVWFDAVASQATRYRRELTNELRILQAWDAAEDGAFAPSVVPPCFLHPFAVRWCPPRRFVYVRIYGVAFPRSLS